MHPDNRFSRLVSAAWISLLLWPAAGGAEPLSLDDCLRIALQRNGRMASSGYGVRAAEERFREASAVRRPVASLRGGASAAPLEGLDPNVTNGGEYAGLLDVKHTLYDGGALGLGRREAEVGVRQAANERARTTADVRLDVRTAYIELVGTRKRHRLMQESIHDLESYLETVRSLANAGAVPKTDILKVELQLRSETMALAGLRADEAAATQRLLEGVGLPADTTVAVQDTIALPAVPDRFAEAANAELEGARLGIRVAEIETALASAERHPVVSLLGSVGGWTSRLQLHEPGERHIFGYQAGVGLDLPVWNWGAMSARIGQKNAGLLGQRADYTVLRRHLESEYRSKLERSRTAEQQLALLEESRKKALEQYDLVVAQYAGGGASSLEVLDAHRTALDIQLQQVQTQADLGTLHADMLRQIGEPR